MPENNNFKYNIIKSEGVAVIYNIKNLDNSIYNSSDGFNDKFWVNNNKDLKKFKKAADKEAINKAKFEFLYNRFFSEYSET